MGDAAHAMQPNLGQGGCMAIEDAFQLCLEFGKGLLNARHINVQKTELRWSYDVGEGQKTAEEYTERIAEAVRRRAVRAAAIHWLAAMAAISASTYKASNRLTQITHVEGVMNCRHIWAKGSVLSLLSPNTRFRTSVE